MPLTISVAMPGNKYGRTCFPASDPATDEDGLQNIRKSHGLTHALDITTDELFGVKPPKVERIDDDSELSRIWKRFQMVAVLPERDQKAAIRMINSLAALVTPPKNGIQGARHGR